MDSVKWLNWGCSLILGSCLLHCNTIPHIPHQLSYHTYHTTSPIIQLFDYYGFEHGLLQKFLQGGGNADISLILFQVANDAMQMYFTKRFTLFTPQRIFPMKARAPFALFWNRIHVELYSSLRKGSFCHPLKLLLNWDVIKYHYYRELRTTESELGLKYPRLRLRCSH